MGDFNLDQLDKAKYNKLNNLLETYGFGLLNAINKDAVTRLKTGTILDLAATNMLHYHYKISIVHLASSDHAAVYTSINRNAKLPSTTFTKRKFDQDLAIPKVIAMCESNDISCGNDLNIALEKIVEECTSTIAINSTSRNLT